MLLARVVVLEAKEDRVDLIFFARSKVCSTAMMDMILAHNAIVIKDSLP